MCHFLRHSCICSKYGWSNQCGSDSSFNKRYKKSVAVPSRSLSFGFSLLFLQNEGPSLIVIPLWTVFFFFFFPSLSLYWQCYAEIVLQNALEVLLICFLWKRHIGKAKVTLEKQPLRVYITASIVNISTTCLFNVIPLKF